MDVQQQSGVIKISNTITNTPKMELTKLSKKELLIKCDNLGITKCKSKCKEDLIKLISTKMIILVITQIVFQLTPLIYHHLDIQEEKREHVKLLMMLFYSILI